MDIDSVIPMCQGDRRLISFLDPDGNQSLTSNYERLQRGCCPEWFGPVSRCSVLGISRTANPIGVTVKLPDALGQVVRGRNPEMESTPRDPETGHVKAYRAAPYAGFTEPIGLGFVCAEGTHHVWIDLHTKSARSGNEAYRQRRMEKKSTGILGSAMATAERLA